MNQAKKKKHLKNYLDLLPIPALAKIVFYLPKADRTYALAKMPEFKEALVRHSYYLITLSIKAYDLLEKDNDLKSAETLVRKHAALSHPLFCKTIATWAFNGNLGTSTLEVAEMILHSAKEIDPTCSVGSRMGLLSVDDDYADFEDGSLNEEYDWKSNPGEYVKVIWVRFGSIIVHYWLQPKLTDLDFEPHAYFDLHVYSETSNRKIIYAAQISNWTDQGHCIRQGTINSIGQLGYLEITDEMIIFGTAIALAAAAGRTYNVEQRAHSVQEDTFCIVQPIADVLEHCGRNISTKRLAKSSTTDSYIFHDRLA